jgi:hypothetical protein
VAPTTRTARTGPSGYGVRVSETFVVTVADVPWFQQMLAVGLFSGQVEALHSVPPDQLANLRPEISGDLSKRGQARWTP